MKRQLPEWEKITANETTEKGLISKIYKQLIQLHARKTATQSKSRKKTWTDISPKKTYRWLTNTWKDAQHHSLEKCKSNLTPVRMAIIKKSIYSKSWRRYGEKGMLLHFWWECKLIQPLWKTVWAFLKKPRIKTTMWPSNPITRHIPWGNQNCRRHMYPNVYCTTIYNS